MSSLMSPNGRARETLADQIDRLDRVLDGLAEGLNEAVAMEVKRAVELAVRDALQAAIREVLTNPELAARLKLDGSPLPAHVTAHAGAGGRLRSLGSRVARWALVLRRCLGRWATSVVEASVSAAVNARAAVATRADQLSDVAGRCWDRVKAVRLVWPQLVRALAVGLALAALAFLAGPYLASAFSGGGGFAAALAAQFARPWCRSTSSTERRTSDVDRF